MRVVRRFWCRVRRHANFWLIVDNGSGVRLMQCRECGTYRREDYGKEVA